MAKTKLKQLEYFDKITSTGLTPNGYYLLCCIRDSKSSITLNELKDGSAGSSTSTSTLSLDFGNIISINDSGGTVLLSYRIYDDDAIYNCARCMIYYFFFFVSLPLVLLIFFYYFE